MDPFAMMDISPNKQSSAKNFAEIVKILSNTPNIELQKASSKKSALYVQGTGDYVEIMTQALAEAGVDKSEIEIKQQTEADIEKRGYKKMKVSKVTFIIKQKNPAMEERDRIALEIGRRFIEIMELGVTIILPKIMNINIRPGPLDSKMKQ